MHETAPLSAIASAWASVGRTFSPVVVALLVAGGGACRRGDGTPVRSAASLTAAVEARAPVPSPARDDLTASARVRHRRTIIDGVGIFYREAGDPKAPTVLLLHGFPSSSHMFRHLIPALADRYHVLAPDYPGFGFSDFPPQTSFNYSFASYASLLVKLTERLGVDRYAIYIQDYGAPVGLRLALLHPERVSALIVQNGNAYEEGLSNQWGPLRSYWLDPSRANRERVRAWLTAEGTRQQYLAGVNGSDAELFAPETWTIDWTLLNRPGNLELQLDLFLDYRTNVDLYPAFQRFFRTYQPPTLIVWGRNDPFFTVEGARAYLRDLPRAELHLLDGSHFALESHAPDVVALARAFLARASTRSNH